MADHSRKSRFSWLVPLLVALSLLGLCASVYSFYRAYNDANLQLQRQALGFEQKQLSSRLRSELASGKSGSEVELTLVEFSQSIDQLGVLLESQGDTAGVHPRVQKAFNNLRQTLSESGAASNDGEPEAGQSASDALNFVSLVESTSALRSQLARLDAPVMQLESSGHLYQLAVSVEKKVSAGLQGKTPAQTARGPWLVFDQILKRLEAMLGTGEITDADATTLITEIRAQQVELSQWFNNPAAVSITSLDENNGLLAASVQSPVSQRHQLLDDTLDASATAIAALRSNGRIWLTLGLMTALVSSAILGLMCLWLWRRSQALRLRQRENENKQQASILRLLDEISALAEGDLNTRATVSEDMTGAIADSVNYAVGELRRLVGSIMNSADRVTVAVEETGATAQQLANASAVQSREISRSSTYLKAMADTMQQVSERSAEASSIAQRSVELASTGRDSVARTEAGMQSIRTHSNKTKVVLKRLGDSSRQIGRTVNLMNEVSEKTRLLAMNAAIQASSRSSSATQASRVADQVQTLASTLAHCNAEVNNLVVVIQQDIASAIATMEDTNNEVMGVSQLAEQADGCLSEIQDVSQRLSVVVNYLTGRVKRQSGVVNQLSSNMGVINEVTQHSAHGLRLSASALEDLRLMANELRDGVSDFSLPQADSEAIARRSAAINGRLAQSHLPSGIADADPVPESLTSSPQPVQQSASQSMTGQAVVTRPGVRKRSIVLEESEMTQVIDPPIQVPAQSSAGGASAFATKVSDNLPAATLASATLYPETLASEETLSEQTPAISLDTDVLSDTDADRRK